MPHLCHSVATYQSIRERILALDADIDEDTLTDTLEGESDLHEVIAAVVRSALVDEAHVDGLKGHIQALQDRLRRLSERASERRRIARDAMVEVELKKITAPDFTLSLRPAPARAMIVDEEAVPESYLKPQPPKLDRQAILDDLKAGASVRGAVLSNQEPTLSVRVR